MEYETKSHCKYLISLHLILVVKYRKPLLNGRLGEFVKKTVFDVSTSFDFEVEESEAQVQRQYENIYKSRVNTDSSPRLHFALITGGFSVNFR